MQKETKLLRNSLLASLAVLASLALLFLFLKNQEIFIKNTVQISGIVVPHHDIVKAQRNAFLDEVAKKIKAPKTIILVSPNHYEAGEADVQTTDKIWDLSNGKLEPNLSALVGAIETSSFQNEHGIYTVLPDLHRVWPEARVVPIILKFGAKIDELAKELDQNCHDCLLVASVDFSHYQPMVLANEHDQLTLRALQNLDENLIRTKAEVDSPATLQLLMQWAKSHDTQKFELKNHTNFGLTSHMFGYYTEGLAVQPLKRGSFLIGGDMMFARRIHYAFQGDLKKSVANLGERLFWGTDLALINLEGMVSTTPVVPDPRPTFNFVFPPETIGVLKFLHINAVSIDNNHANGIQPRGMQTLPVTIQGEGLKITVIGIHTLWGVADIKDQISKIKMDPDQRVIIFPHWGEEYQPIHNKQQEELAHAWIDAGADMVVGAHPHVVQDIETYRGKPIFYSLGNLLFDQDWSVPTQHGLLVGGAFTEEGVEYFTLPVVSKNLQPTVDFSGVSDIVKLP